MVKNKKKSLTTISTISEDIPLESTLKVDDKIVNETQLIELAKVDVELEQKPDTSSDEQKLDTNEQKPDSSSDSKKNELVVIEIKPEEQKEEVSTKNCNRRLCSML